MIYAHLAHLTLSRAWAHLIRVSLALKDSTVTLPLLCAAPQGHGWHLALHHALLAQQGFTAHPWPHPSNPALRDPIIPQRGQHLFLTVYLALLAAPAMFSMLPFAQLAQQALTATLHPNLDYFLALFAPLAPTTPFLANQCVPLVRRANFLRQQEELAIPLANNAVLAPTVPLAPHLVPTHPPRAQLVPTHYLQLHASPALLVNLPLPQAPRQRPLAANAALARTILFLDLALPHCLALAVQISSVSPASCAPLVLLTPSRGALLSLLAWAAPLGPMAPPMAAPPLQHVAHVPQAPSALSSAASSLPPASLVPRAPLPHPGAPLSAHPVLLLRTTPLVAVQLRTPAWPVLQAPPAMPALLVVRTAPFAPLALMAPTLVRCAFPAPAALAATTWAPPLPCPARSVALAPTLQPWALVLARPALWAPTPPTLALPLQAAVYPALLATRKCALARPVSSARLELFSPML